MGIFFLPDFVEMLNVVVVSSSSFLLQKSSQLPDFLPPSVSLCYVLGLVCSLISVDKLLLVQLFWCLIFNSSRADLLDLFIVSQIGVILQLLGFSLI